jgi:hypothetical protein
MQLPQRILSTKVWPQARLWLHRQRELESGAPSHVFSLGRSASDLPQLASD